MVSVPVLFCNTKTSRIVKFLFSKIFSLQNKAFSAISDNFAIPYLFWYCSIADSLYYWGDERETTNAKGIETMPTNLELVAKLDEVMQLLHALPNEVSNAHFRNIVRPILEVKTWLQFNGAATSSCCSNLERDNAAKQAEIERLEKELEGGDHHRCETCRRMFDIRDLVEVNGDKYCPDHASEAAAEVAELEDTEAMLRGIR